MSQQRTFKAFTPTLRQSALTGLPSPDHHQRVVGGRLPYQHPGQPQRALRTTKCRNSAADRLRMAQDRATPAQIASQAAPPKTKPVAGLALGQGRSRFHLFQVRSDSCKTLPDAGLRNKSTIGSAFHGSASGIAYQRDGPYFTIDFPCSTPGLHCKSKPTTSRNCAQRSAARMTHSMFFAMAQASFACAYRHTHQRAALGQAHGGACGPVLPPSAGIFAPGIGGIPGAGVIRPSRASRRSAASSRSADWQPTGAGVSSPSVPGACAWH